MGVIDKYRFEHRGGHGCSNSDYLLHKTTCCGSFCVEDDELLDLYIDPTDLEKTIQDHGDFLAHIKVQSYVSKALVDVEENEIVLKTEEELIPRPPAVGALLGDNKL